MGGHHKYHDPKRKYCEIGRQTPNEDRIYEPDELEFMMHLDRYKRANRKPFPTCRDILTVIKSLGYRKVGDES